MRKRCQLMPDVWLTQFIYFPPKFLDGLALFRRLVRAIFGQFKLTKICSFRWKVDAVLLSKVFVERCHCFGFVVGLTRKECWQAAVQTHPASCCTIVNGSNLPAQGQGLINVSPYW